MTEVHGLVHGQVEMLLYTGSDPTTGCRGWVWGGYCIRGLTPPLGAGVGCGGATVYGV